MTSSSSFDELVAEGDAAPTEGWSFDWFDGRATEERPPWGYAAQLAERLGGARSVLDLQTGGGEVFAEALGGASAVPAVVRATESWPPNAELARRALAPFGGEVVERGDDGAFDLVCSRHPVDVPWAEVARVLRPGGTFLAQLIGPATNRELTEALMGPQPVRPGRDAASVRSAAEAIGLEVVDLRDATCEVRFLDIGAVVHFLRKVIWTVPDFSVDRYRPQLRALHEVIEREGAFVSHSTRVLAEARLP